MTALLAEDETRRVMDALRRLVRVLGSSARSFPDAQGVSGAQLFVLRTIAASPGLSIRELAVQTLTGQSTVSEVVARLVRRRLVSRSASVVDRRQVQLTLSAAGQRMIDGAGLTAQERLVQGLRAMPRTRRVTLANALDQWLQAAAVSDEPATMFFEESSAPSAPARLPRRRAKLAGPG